MLLVHLDLDSVSQHAVPSLHQFLLLQLDDAQFFRFEVYFLID